MNRVTAPLVALIIAGCHAPKQAPNAAAAPSQPQSASSQPAAHAAPADARAAVEALRTAQFEQTVAAAHGVLAADKDNAQASVALAVALYRQLAHDLTTDTVTLIAGLFASGALGIGGFNQRFLDFSLRDAERRLGDIDASLQAAAADPSVALELCMACWQVDWNHDGRIDESDERILQIEVDADGQELPDGDPRRTPTFRFDVGDVLWARAMVSFQRAATSLLLAYDFTDLARLIASDSRRGPGPVTLRLVDRQRVLAARDMLLQGLAAAEASRRAILAETDDDREWLPNPRQKSHPMPLPVDEPLFATWEGVIADIHDLLDGKTGLDIAALAQLGDEQWQKPPRGFLNVAKLLAEPGDIVLDPEALERAAGYEHRREDVETVLREVFGDKYVMQMRATPLLARLTRMKSEIDRGEESLERKLRYLIWLN